MAADVAAVGRRLRGLRQRAGLSQADLAAAAGVSRQTVGALEAGRHLPRVDAALALAAALHTTVEDLLAAGPAPAVSVSGEALVEGQPVRAARVGELVACVPLPSSSDGESWQPPDAVVRRGRAAPLDDASLDGFVLVGCDPALGLLAALGPTGAGRLLAVPGSSGAARQALVSGRAHAALVHGVRTSALRCPDGVRRLALARWRTGLAAPGGAAGALAAALAGGGPVVQREDGAAAQEAYVRALARAGVTAAPGPRAKGHLDAGRRAAADGLAAVTIEPVARALGLDFRALETHAVEVWIAPEAAGHPGAQALGDVIASAAFRQRAGAFAGYEVDAA